MKTFLPVFCAALLATLPCSSSLAAIDAGSASADARWLLQLDLNELRQTTLGQNLLELLAQNAPANHNNLGIQIDFQKLLATVGRATAYGVNFEKDPKEIDGALIIEGTDDLRKIAEGYIAQALISDPERTVEIKGLPFEAYQINGDVFLGFPKEPIVLVSKMKPQLVRAYEVYRKKSPSIAETKSAPLHGLIPSGANVFLVAGSVVPSEDFTNQAGPQARLIKMARAGSIAVGEKDKFAFANLRLMASDSEMADKLQKIVQGLTAMVSLAHTDDKDMDDFLKSVTVERENLSVRVNLSYPSTRLVELIKQRRSSHVEMNNSGPHHHHREPKGKLVAEWKADQNLGSGTPSEATLVTHTIEHLHLPSGAVLHLVGAANAGEHARIDFVDIRPVDGPAAPLKFEAEYMKLDGYQVEDQEAASAGKLIKTDSSNAVAEFQFPGASGEYTVDIRYCDENDGVSTYKLYVEEPNVEPKP
jgi:hypothetical protein